MGNVDHTVTHGSLVFLPMLQPFSTDPSVWQTDGRTVN